MAHSFVKPTFISSLLLALFYVSLTLSSSSARTVQVYDICSKHSDLSNCTSILNSLPSESPTGADLDALTRDIMNLSRIDAFHTRDTINDLIRNTTEEDLRKRYSSCAAYYMDALFNIDNANSSYSSGDYSIGMKSNAQNALNDVQDCDSKPPHDPSMLPEINKYMQDVLMIIMILADFLSGIY